MAEHPREWSTLAGLLGVGPGPIRWERPLLWLGACFCGNLVWLILWPVFMWMTERPMYSYLDSIRFQASLEWLRLSLDSLLLLALAMLFFRVIAHPLIAFLVTIIGYLPVNFGLFYFDMDMKIRWGMLWPWAFTVLSLGGLMLALRWIRPLWVALAAGFLAGRIFYWGLYCLVNWLMKDSNAINFELTRAIPIGILEVLILASVLSLLWLICRDKRHDNLARPPRLRRGFYIGTLAVGFAVNLIFDGWAIFVFITGQWKEIRNIIGFLIMEGLLCLLAIYVSVVFCVFIYKCWTALQDGQTRISPGRAVGFLFIPFFNFYWGFRVLAGFAREYNDYIHRHGIDAPQLSPVLGVIYMVLCIVSLVPLLGILAVLVNLFIVLFMVARYADAVNALPDSSPAGVIATAPAN